MTCHLTLVRPERHNLMKKLIPIFTLTVLAITVGTVVLIYNPKKEPDVVYIGSFHLSEHQRDIDSFPLERNVGNMEDCLTAAERAKEIWIEVFGTEFNGEPRDPTRGRPVVVYYDDDNECWLVCGTLPPNPFLLGGVPYTIIRSDGEVLAVWHDM
jgi:hypothetical protein